MQRRQCQLIATIRVLFSMMIDSIAAILPLAASDEPGWVASLVGQIYLYGLVAFGIGFVIFVHEMGHFLAAKTFGVKCEKFYVGFDVPISIGPIKFPRTLGKFQYGETEYGIGIIPLGGYVKMLGQDDDPRKQEEEAKRIQVEGGDEDETQQLDPRSYPAKPVWQRMIIISAGVVMNVISGVLFAAIAFGLGVAYTPARVGGVTPGGPAWQAGIKPGGQVVAVGRLEQDQMHFRDMRMSILTEGMDDPTKPVDISIRFDNEVLQYELVATPHPNDNGLRMIGISPPKSTTLSKTMYAGPGSVAEATLGVADAGARVVAFDGTAVNEDSVVPGVALFDYLYSNPSKTIKLRIKRTDGSVHDVDLPPQSAKTIGLRFSIGPVVALLKDGPAEQAGVEVGDVITSVNGDDSVDAFGLPLMLAGSKEQVKMTFRRGSGTSAKTIDVELTPIAIPQTLDPTAGIRGEVAISVLGLCYQPSPNISRLASTTSQNSSEDSSSDPVLGGGSLQVGDRLQEVKLAWSEEEIPEHLLHERYELSLDELRNGWEFGSTTPLSRFVDAVQFLPVGTKLHLKATRPGEGNGASATVVSATVVVGMDDRFVFERELIFTASESVQSAASFGEAMSLGVREGKRKLSEVFRFLGMLTRGRVALKHAAGPIGIVQIAKQETERGISRQLMFLTLLSMNLAILNFLPIPALDGGHMMFLLYELVRGKRADEMIEFRLTLVGVIALLALMVVVFANDIMRLLS